MAVDDHGLEVLKKSGEEVTPGDKSDYYIKVKDQALIDAINNLITFVDQLEGFTDGIEGLLTTLNGYVDQLEGFTDGIEGLLTSIDGGIPAALGETTMANSMPVVIASDQTRVPVRNRTEPQYQATQQNAFALIVDTVNAQTAETKLLSIENTSLTKSLHIYSACTFVDPGNNNYCRFKYYIGNTGISAGTAQTPRNIYVGSATTSSTTVKSLPTVTTLGNQIASRTSPAGNTQGAQYVGELLGGYWILPPSTNIVITGTAKANNVPVVINLEWFETVVG